MASQWAQRVCFVLIVVMNLSAWIDLFGLFIEVPLIIPLTPEGWTLPSAIVMCMSVANIAPALLIILRWRQGKKFSEIPYIYMIIIIGIISCCVLAMFWDRTALVFGRERSVWLLAAIFTLSTLDCTSSLVFFDYMKRFRAHYLTAVFLGEGLTGVIPTLLALVQGIGSEAICVWVSNGTVLEPNYTQPRFSVTVFMFLIAGIIVLSLIAFILLRWTNIVSMADAAKLEADAKSVSTLAADKEEASPMVSAVKSQVSESASKLTKKILILLLLLTVFNSAVLFGCMPSLGPYSMLPYGQKAFYYSTVLNPIAYLLVLLLSIRWKTISTLTTILGSVVGFILCVFIVAIAWQSPCPWWADTTHGAIIMVIVWFLTTMIIAYVRITIGNRIRLEWPSSKAMFYFGTSVQLGMFLGSVPTYSLINVFGVFVERKPCQSHCLS